MAGCPQQEWSARREHVPETDGCSVNRPRGAISPDPQGHRAAPPSRRRAGRRLDRAPIGVAIALALLLTACGSSEGSTVPTLGDGGGASPSGSAAPQQNQEEAILALTQCLRDKGFDVQDPTFDEEGNPQFGSESGIDRTDPEVRAALSECQEEVGGGFGGFDPDAEQQAELQDSLVAFAECMRGQGIDFPDPDLSGGGGGGRFGDIDLTDPEIQAALELCQEELGLTETQRGGG